MMASESAPQQKTLSGSWSCDTLGRGLNDVMGNVKTECLADVTDRELQERLKVGFGICISHAFFLCVSSRID